MKKTVTIESNFALDDNVTYKVETQRTPFKRVINSTRCYFSVETKDNSHVFLNIIVTLSTVRSILSEDYQIELRENELEEIVKQFKKYGDINWSKGDKYYYLTINF